MQSLTESFQVDYDYISETQDMLFDIVSKIRKYRQDKQLYDYFCWLTRSSTTGRTIIDIANDGLLVTQDDCFAKLASSTNLVGHALDTYIQELYRKFKNYR